MNDKYNEYKMLNLGNVDESSALLKSIMMIPKHHQDMYKDIVNNALNIVVVTQCQYIYAENLIHNRS